MLREQTKNRQKLILISKDKKVYFIVEIVIKVKLSLELLSPLTQILKFHTHCIFPWTPKICK